MRKAILLLTVLMVAFASSSAEFVAGVLSAGYGPASNRSKLFVFEPDESTKYGTFADCLALAQKEHVPLFILLTSNDSNSSAFIEAVNSDYRNFIGNLRPLLPAIFGLCSNGSPKSAAQFAADCGASGAYPQYACYWLHEDGSVHKAGGSCSGTGLSFTSKARAFIRNNQPKPYEPPKGNCGFVCGDTALTRLEALPETASVSVPLVRTNNLTNVETNWMVTTYPIGGVTVTNELAWAADGLTATNLDIAVAMTGQWTNDGQVAVSLFNAKWEKFADRTIACVSGPTNGTFFSPCRVAEKGTADELAWGEWTLDYAAATGKVAAAVSERVAPFTLKVTGSPVWDDRAIAFAESVFASAIFKDLCSGHYLTNDLKTVYLAPVLCDRADPATGASLTSHRIAANGRSGTPYLSRNGLLADESSPVGDEFSVEVLRPDGSSVGRLVPQRTAAGEYDCDENTYRIIELILSSVDENESSNNDPVTTAMTLAVGESSPTNEVSICDSEDVFILTGLEAGKAMSFGLADVSSALAPETLEKFAKPNVRIKVATDAEKTAWRELPPALDGVWIFSDEDLASGVAAVVGAWQDAEIATVGTYAAGDGSFVSYVLKAEVAQENKGTFYLPVTNAEYQVEAETNDLPIRIVRTGYTGAAEVRLELDDELTTAPVQSYEMVTQTVTWAENEWGEKTNAFVRIISNGDWDEGGDIVIKVTSGTEAVDLVGTNRFHLTVYQKDDPTAPAGKLAFVEPSPAEKLYVAAGSVLTAKVARIGGKRGELDARVTAAKGTLETNLLHWAKFKTAAQDVVWTLPDQIPAQGRLDVNLTLTGLNGAQTASMSNRISVCVLSADALRPAGDVRSSFVQYCAYSNAVKFIGEVPVGAIVTPSRISGSIPPGVKVTWNKATQELAFVGSSSSVGVYEATYWLQVRAGSTITYSYPVKIRIEVLLLASKDGKSGVNPTFASARTWTSLPLVDIEERTCEGLADMTVSAIGRLSARCRLANGKVLSFSSTGLTDCNPAGGLATVKAVRSGYEFFAQFYPDGRISLTLTPPEGGIGYSYWSDGAAKPLGKSLDASPWQGSYTLALQPPAEESDLDPKTLCTGWPVLQVRFSSASQLRTGTATYAGYLPNGKTVSGSATFAPGTNGTTVVTLPVFFTSATDTLSVPVGIAAAADPEHAEAVVGPMVMTYGSEPLEIGSYWAHTEANLPDVSYANAYLPIGSRYVNEGWDLSEVLPSTVKSYQFNKTTGLLSGTLKAPHPVTGRDATMSWRGVLLPGCDPCLAGSYWTAGVTNALNVKTGREVRRSVVFGGAVVGENN